MNKPQIHCHNIYVHYHKRPALWSVDLEIECGDFCAIVGPNGSGKSTLLKSLAGLIPITSGTIDFYNTPQKKESQKPKIAYLPQRESIDWDFPINVLDLVLMGTYPTLGFGRRPGKNEITKALQALEQVDLVSFRERQISELSGGQQQRAFFARALVQEADIYLLDEPFAAIDAKTEKILLDTLKNLNEKNKTILVVHHDLYSVYENFKTIILLNQRLVAMGPIEKVFTLKNLQEAYGGQLEIFSKVLHSMEKHE